MRKVIQLMSMPVYGGTDWLYALCEDGSVWARACPRGEWKHIGEPPPEDREAVS